MLEAAKVPMVTVPETFSEDRHRREDQLVGHAMGADARADASATRSASDLAQLRELRDKVTKPGA